MMKENLKNRLTDIYSSEKWSNYIKIIIGSFITIGYLGILIVWAYQEGWNTLTFWLQAGLAAAIMLLPGIGFLSMGLEDNKKTAKMYERQMAVIDSLTEEELAKEYFLKGNVPCIKGKNQVYYLPDHPEYDTIRAEEYFESQYEALRTYHLPA